MVVMLDLSTRGTIDRWNLSLLREQQQCELGMDNLKRSLGSLKYCSVDDPYSKHLLGPLEYILHQLENRVEQPPETTSRR
jgi:hypothetical protein